MSSLSTSNNAEQRSILFRALPALPFTAGQQEKERALLPVASSNGSCGLDTDVDEGNDADLLLESTFAALWNTACLLYLLQPTTATRELEWGTLNTFITLLIFLIALPLGLGLAAGASAVTDPMEHRRWMMPVAWVATTACLVGGWVLCYFVVEGQNKRFQLVTILTMLCGQGILIYRSVHVQGRIRLDATDEEQMMTEKVEQGWVALVVE